MIMITVYQIRYNQSYFKRLFLLKILSNNVLFVTATIFILFFSPNIALKSEMNPVEQLLQEDLILEFSENCASQGIYCT